MPRNLSPMKGHRVTDDLLFGIFLLALAVVTLWSIRKLPLGNAADMGPGYIPNAIAWGLGAFGAWFVGKSLVSGGKVVPAPFWRGLVLVPCAVGVFALLVNTAGLALASFLSMVTVSLACAETRIREVLVFSAAISAGAVLLFVKALALPVPVFPWW